jgi:hypothetical protein
MKREEYIIKEIWILTISGAFQRANIYKPNVEKEKTKFKSDLFLLIDGIAKEYVNDVSETKHLKNINSIKKELQQYQHILQEGQLNFGVSQKLLNLYLKYLWCLGKIPKPPHFPVDRRIQEKMRFSVKSWTKNDFNEEKYKIIIEEAKKLAIEFQFQNVAEFELFLFNNDGDISTLKQNNSKK